MPHDPDGPPNTDGIRPALTVVVLAMAACYQPHIADGGLKCAPPPEKACPDGFFCDPSSICRNHPPGDAMPIDQPSEARPETVPVPDVPSDPGADKAEAMCIQPRAMCTSQSPAGMCDPYCQSGCACNQRCLINAAGAPTCSQPLAPGNLAVGQTCVVASSGTSSQTDACAPGSVCIREACGMHCFTYCRTDADCPNSTCSRPATELMGNPGGFKVCEVPFATCDPLKPHMDCPSTAETCYLSSVAADRTFCACHNGDKRENDPCDSTEDCFPGLVCVGAGTAGDSRCRAVCGMGTVIPCNGNATCRPVNGSKTYGYCL